jgi:transcriptional regulator with XRE-family HTH domain
VPGQPTPAAIRLALRLRQLREEASVTQAALAAAFSPEQQVGPATVSSWENVQRPSTPPEARLERYARFFATPRSLAGEPHLISLKELKSDEIDLYDSLHEELRELWAAVRGTKEHEAPVARRSWFFDDPGPVTIICPEAPVSARGPLASPGDPNFTRMYLYGDLDALIELHGHIRAENSPSYGVFHRLASEVQADDLSGHVVLLGGVGWNDVTRHLLRTLSNVPIRQLADERVKSGEIFSAHAGESDERFYPTWAPDDETELIEDVALLARVPNPFNGSRTLTICNGIHSRGVLGAVRSLTDARVRDANETYIADRFPKGEFALLLRVPVVQGQALSPDIANSATRLFEWPTGSSKATR